VVAVDLVDPTLEYTLPMVAVDLVDPTLEYTLPVVAVDLVDPTLQVVISSSESSTMLNIGVPVLSNIAEIIIYN
jgi:hypothetical protein